MSQASQATHVLQMYVGDIDEDAVAGFADEIEAIDDWHIQEMADIDSAAITFTGGTLSDSLLDNYFVTQPEDFDFLLDTKGNQPATVDDGELGLPVVPLRWGPGDGHSLPAGIHEFTISALVRDGQRGSSMASSIRLLVSDKDFERLIKDAPRTESGFTRPPTPRRFYAPTRRTGRGCRRTRGRFHRRHPPPPSHRHSRGGGGRQILQVQSSTLESFVIPTNTGAMPREPGEIALSTLNAERLGVVVGDTIRLSGAGDFTVTATYQDVTNGGLTAKVVQP